MQITHVSRCVQSLFLGLSLMFSACGNTDSQTEGRAAELSKGALYSSGSSAPSDVDAGPWTPNPAKGCEGFPLEGQCTAQNGVSGRILCTEGAGKRFYPCPEDWTCKRDGDFYGCLPNK